MFGSGDYRLQPIYVDDFAKLAVDAGRTGTNAIIDAIGPETFTYRELAKLIGKIIGRPRPIISIPPSLGYWASVALGFALRDVPLTREEIEGLMADLLVTTSPASGDDQIERLGARPRRRSRQALRERARPPPQPSRVVRSCVIVSWMLARTLWHRIPRVGVHWN